MDSKCAELAFLFVHFFVKTRNVPRLIQPLPNLAKSLWFGKILSGACE